MERKALIVVACLAVASVSVSAVVYRPARLTDTACLATARTLAAQAEAGNVTPWWRAAYAQQHVTDEQVASIPLAYQVQLFQWAYGPRYRPLERWLRWGEDRYTTLAYTFCMRNRATGR